MFNHLPKNDKEQMGRDSTLDRRQFLTSLARYGGGIGAAGILAGNLTHYAYGSDQIYEREAEYYERLAGGSTRCKTCPRECELKDNETSHCRGRINRGGMLYSRGYGEPCVVRIDPVELLPLNHFLPGTRTLTLGVGGCNLNCQYCHNWQQSQSMPDTVKTFRLTPQEVIKEAKKRDINIIAFNYTGLISFLEYALDIAKLAKASQIRVIAATAAYVNPTPLLDFARYVDAFTITLKGFDDNFYQQIAGAQLTPVLSAIKAIKSNTSCWLELVNLVVPTYNDDGQKIREMTDWVAQTCGNETPFHFTRLTPAYHLTDLPSTLVPTLEDACRIAQQSGLKYIYTSNIAPHPNTHTYCLNCGASLIQRLNLQIIDRQLTADGKCLRCGTPLPGIWI
ncbi:MAG: hypothetical protein HJJLKODD_02707 [Phycisphaerae bacterium]|nr:hypothetical protein [Phycisphaerae bacterium]